MALFGLLKDSKNPNGLSGNDKLALLLSGVSDTFAQNAGQSGGAMDALTRSFAERRAKAAQQALLAKVTGALTGSFDTPLRSSVDPGGQVAPERQAMPDVGAPLTSGFNPGALPQLAARLPTTNLPQLNLQPSVRSAPQGLNDPALQQALAAGALGGIHGIGDVISLMDKARPKVEVANGVAYDPYRTAPGTFFTQYDKGQGPDGAGGVRNMPGALQSAADMASAVSGAQEGAKSAYDIIQVPQRDGSVRSMTRFQAAQLLGGQGGPVPAGLGVSQTPGDKVAQEGTAKTNVERAAAEPQQWSGLQSQARTTDLVIDNIDKALKQISPLSTGFAANLGGIKGTTAHDLQATLDAIRANIGFDRLQEMRNNSPTGGALGSVSEQENRLLQSVMGSLDAGQSADQLKANLKTVRDQLAQIREQRKSLYGRTYGKGVPTSPKAPPAANYSRSAIETEMRRRGLIP